MTGIIIQARMGSSRLPGKVLKDISGKKLLEHIMYRLSFLKAEVTIVIATSILNKDDVIAEYCESHGWNCFRGSEENVLERYYSCAVKYGFSEIIRLTADNPFYDIEELDKLIELFQKSDAQYAKSFDVLPYGVGAEIFTFEALEKSCNEASLPHHFEHVNEYILENPQIFKTLDLPAVEEKCFPQIRLTVDTEEDHKRACYILANSSDEFVSTAQAIKLAKKFEKESKES